MKIFFSTVFVLVGILGISLHQESYGQSSEREEIVIGFIPTENAEELTPKADELATFLENRFNNTVDFNVLVTNTYEPLIEGLRFGHVDAAFMDTGPAWIAHNRTGASVELAEVVDGKIYYQATVFARADDNSTQNLNQTLGKNVAFTSLTGSSGFIVPIGSLIERGLIDVNGDDFVAVIQALDNAFESHIASRGYKEALTLLLNGNVDIAFGANDSPQRFLTPSEQGQVRVVEEIGKVPSHVFIVSEGMPVSTKDKLIDAMLELNFPENNHILKNIYGAEALLPTTTEGHIGEFGGKIAAIAGIDTKLFENID
jgi:phosphonate transport system substrate-binding protein